jgi:hypothetical protein
MSDVDLYPSLIASLVDNAYFKESAPSTQNGLSTSLIITVIMAVSAAAFIIDWHLKYRPRKSLLAFASRLRPTRRLRLAAAVAAITIVSLFSAFILLHYAFEYAASAPLPCGANGASTLLRIETGTYKDDSWPQLPPSPAAAAAAAARHQRAPQTPPPPPVVTQWVAMTRRQCEAIRCAWVPARRWPAGGGGGDAHPGGACSTCTCRPW